MRDIHGFHGLILALATIFQVSYSFHNPGTEKYVTLN